MAKLYLPALPGLPWGVAIAQFTRRFIRWVVLLFPLAIFLLALVARLIPGPRTIDDSYITFRYARNILAGNGFVFNPGERVLGTTTPLFTGLLVILGAITAGTRAPFPQLALLLSAIADGVTCLLLLDLGRRLGSPRAGLGAALFWTIAPFSVTFAIGGMETSLYVMLLLATAYTYFLKRHVLSAFLAALLLLTRPDALILIGPLFLARFVELAIQSRRKITLTGDSPSAPSARLIQEMLAFLVPTLAWVVFASLYFGSPLPHSIAAKNLAYHLPSNAALVRLIQHYATPFMESTAFGVPAIAVGILLYPFLFLAGARRVLRSDLRCLPVLVYPWLYFAVFAMANPLIFRWYLAPPLPIYILVILLGVDAFLSDLFQWKDRATIRVSGRTGGLKILMDCFIVMVPFCLLLPNWTWQPDHGLQSPAPQMAWVQLELLYRQAAEWLTPELSPSQGRLPLLAAGDVGVLGYHTPARILDTVGLNSAVSTSYYPLDASFYAINYAVPPDLILEQRPDFVVILEIYGRKGLLRDPRFWQSYQLDKKFPTSIYGSDGLLIFSRK